MSVESNETLVKTIRAIAPRRGVTGETGQDQHHRAVRVALAVAELVDVPTEVLEPVRQWVDSPGETAAELVADAEAEFNNDLDDGFKINRSNNLQKVAFYLYRAVGAADSHAAASFAVGAAEAAARIISSMNPSPTGPVGFGRVHGAIYAIAKGAQV